MREQAKTPESSFQRAYLRQKKREREQVRVFRALLLVSFLVLWEVAADLRWIDPFIFSSPVRVGKTFVTLLTEQNLLRHIGITVYETGISFLLVSALGMAFAVLLWLFPRFSAVMEPYLVVLNSLPKSALAPLLIVWMGANVKTIITAGISVAIFGSVISIYSSFQGVEPDMLRLIATLGGTKKDMLFRVVLPWSLPGLLAVWKVNIGLCLVGVVIGEFIGAREGLGYLIIYGSQVFRYAHAREGRMTAKSSDTPLYVAKINGKQVYELVENYLADADENFYVTNKYELPIASGMKMIVNQEESGFSLKDLTVNDKKIDKEKEYSILLTDTTMSVLKKINLKCEIEQLKDTTLSSAWTEAMSNGQQPSAPEDYIEVEQ